MFYYGLRNKIIFVRFSGVDFKDKGEGIFYFVLYINLRGYRWFLFIFFLNKEGI